MTRRSGGGGLRLRRRVVTSRATLGLFGKDLMVLQEGLALFFQNEGPGMGGERNKRCLSHRLAIFQFLENHRGFGLFWLYFWYFWACDKL